MTVHSSLQTKTVAPFHNILEKVFLCRNDLVSDPLHPGRISI